MKVVQLSSVHPSNDTRIFYKICTSLVKAGFDVDLIIQHRKNEIKNKINIIALPVAKKKSDRLFKIIPVLIKKCLKYPKNTIIHFHDPELIPIGFLLKVFGYKIIYDVHEDVPADLSCKPWIPKILRYPVAFIAGALEKVGILIFDSIITVDPNGEKRLRSKKTILIQNFPIITPIESSISKEYNPKGDLFYVGDISEIRGIREMVKCVEMISQRKEIRLILAGKFSPPSLKDELMNYKGWENTNFVGWINRLELNDYLSRSSIGLLLLYPEPHHVRSQPNKLFEYMYGGIPIVSANLPTYKQIVEESSCGLTVDPKNLDEVVDAVTWLLENPLKAKEMGRNGKEAVIKNYNWTQEEKKLVQLYKYLTNKYY
ncbi:MAG: glycosyltransferase family 4 protein [Balneolaceae bacterium]